MPFPSNTDLPSNIRNVLPNRGQTILRKAFNSAFKQGLSEEDAFKIAWAAVKRVFKKKGGRWIMKSNRIFTKSFEIKRDGKDVFVTGYLSTPNLDKVNDIVTWNALESMAEQIKNAGLSFKIGIEHEHILEDSRNLPIAKIIDTGLDDKGLKITTQLNSAHPGFDIVKKSLENGFLDAFSIEFQPLRWRYETMNDGQKIRIIDDLEFGGAAFTGRPANPDCTITDMLIKSLIRETKDNDKNLTEEKSMSEDKIETPKPVEKPLETPEEKPVEAPKAEEVPKETQPEAKETPEEKPEEPIAEAPAPVKEEPTGATEVAPVKPTESETSVEEEAKSLAKTYIKELKSTLREQIKNELMKEIKNMKPDSRVLVPKEVKFEKKSTPFSAFDLWVEQKNGN